MKKLSLGLLILIIMVCAKTSIGQINKEDKPGESFIFTYTPSKLLKKGQIEMQLFNNMYTQTSYRDENREEIELDWRETYYTGMFYMLFGISKTSRINVGFDINLKSVYVDTTKGSPFKVFNFKTTDHSRTAITSLGPKIKFQPFKNVSDFSIQSAFWIPVADDLESIEEFHDYPWMDYHMYTWWNQFFYDKTLGSDWQIFMEVDLLFRFKSDKSNIPSHVDLPLSFFLSWLPLSKATFYYMIQYSPRVQLESSTAFDYELQENYTIDPFTYISDFAHTGIGTKYQLSKKINLEASATWFFTSKNSGAGTTYNLGIRIII